MNNDFAEQRKTADDIWNKLQTSNKCVILRPTGFGKTYILTDLIEKYNNVLYLYPAEVIKDTVINRYVATHSDEYYDDADDNTSIDPETVQTADELKTIPNCTLMTYAKLIRLTDDEIQDMDYDLIIFDEMHRLGGTKTKIATEKLFAFNPNAHFIGATATPNRMDNFDPVAHFFNDIMSYTYTLHDAISDGIIKKPNYYYCTTNIKQDLIDAAKAAGEDVDDKMVKDIIETKAIEGGNLFGMGNIIKEACETHAVNKDYFRFIVYFCTKQHMSEQIEEVEKWFYEAYPTYQINTLKISSTNSFERENVHELDSLYPAKNKIDLIACIDMLNMGYHVSDLTGIVMYRGTKSSTIFIQQLGRALSAGANNSSIVIDVVDNLHKKAVFDLQASLTTKKSKTIKTNTTVKKISNFFVADDKTTIMMHSESGNDIQTQFHINEYNEIVDYHNQPSVFEYDTENNVIYEYNNPTNKNVNQYTREDFQMSGHEATYRDFLAKALAEPLAHRCKYAIEIHFKTWCYFHNVDYPISDKKLKELYGLDKEEFYKEFKRIIKSNNINYNLQDAESYLMNDGGDIGRIDAICTNYNITINQMLDMLGIPQAV